MAERLGYTYLDTGAMYRASGLLVSRSGLAFEDGRELADLISNHRIDVREGVTVLDGEDVSTLIRSPEMSEAASMVSSFGPVRREMVRLQRRIAARRDTVAEGRDMGTVVFPRADLKVFVTADVVQRGLRRLGQEGRKRVEERLPEVVAALLRRDRRDRERADSPLRRAPDAWFLDTTSMSVREQVEAVVGLYRSCAGGGA